ncbi:MAG: META domain-containing protein, partial [Sphingomonas bacterium]|nr:META domain-containing protein [Sphingomonas bacterium]
AGYYGSTKTTPPARPPISGAATRTYCTARLEVAITPGRCSDGMSDLIYRDAVSVRADSKRVTGCGGGTIAPDTLANSSWTVTAINGRRTPSGAGYFINFADRDVSARLGCNSISGSWRLNGDHLSTSDLIQTELGCPEPASTFERLGSAVLNSNMRIEQLDGTRMRLVSEAGSIDLKRAI